ncbi:MAG: hypothetical protein Q8R28_06195, partial [Dehalococcoidia bacterium]|nr:hypothetical protein [Dehalococcoidia bacterium]
NECGPANRLEELMQPLRSPHILAIGLALALALSACSQPEASTPTPALSPTSAPSSSPAASAPATTRPGASGAAPGATAPAALGAPPSGVSVSDLAAKARANTEYSFDMIVSIFGDTITATTYVKGPKIRQEVQLGDQTAMMLVDQSQNVAYLIDYGQKTATKQDVSQSTGQVNPNDAILTFPPDTRIVGADSVDGKQALVLEVPDPDQPSRIWVSADKGLLLRVEATSTPGLVTMSFRNYKFGSLPDSLFELPAGTPIVDAPAETPGVPGSSPAPGR